MVDLENFDLIADRLDAHSDFQVLRRFKKKESYGDLETAHDVYRGIFLDTETTGLDTVTAAVIELGIVPFDFTLDGQILKIYHDLSFSQLNDPGIPIPDVVMQLTGITNEMVAGKSIDPAAVEACSHDATLVIAHNASFDRPIVERNWPLFSDKHWACSMRDIPWKDENIGSAKLDYIAMKLGFFFDGHRAEDDCLAGIEVLSHNLPVSGRPIMVALLESARSTTVRIHAVGAPFEFKGDLKSRGYRWNPGEGSSPKAWWTDVPELELKEELEWLSSNVFTSRDFEARPLPMQRITSATRYKS